jgi:predicted acetyltransferase
MSAPADLRIIQLGPEHADEVIRLDQAGFAFPLAEFDPATDLQEIEWDRTFGAVRRAAGPHQHAASPAWGDDEELAGLATSYSLGLAVPGSGSIPAIVAMAGLTWVNVHPDHRRRGILTQLMRHHLHGLYDAGAEAISGLFAAEAAIYPRFGYGAAASSVSMTLPSGAALRPVPGTDEISTQLTSASIEGSVELVHELSRQAAALRPGGVLRPEVVIRDLLRDRPERSPAAEATKLIVARRHGRPTGYAVFRRRMDWHQGVPSGKVAVTQLVALDAPTEHVLWSRLLSLDLITEVSTAPLGLDHPLFTWLADVRVAGATRADALWIRLVDVPRALAARGYAHDVDEVIELTDDLCPWNAGRWRLRVSGPYVRCEATTDAPGLGLDVRDLATAYLGGPALAAIAAAGLVVEHRPGAVTNLSTALRGLTEPAVPQMF